VCLECARSQVRSMQTALFWASAGPRAGYYAHAMNGHEKQQLNGEKRVDIALASSDSATVGWALVCAVHSPKAGTYVVREPRYFVPAVGVLALVALVLRIGF
jgi:hypothetical protein